MPFIFTYTVGGDRGTRRRRRWEASMDRTFLAMTFPHGMIRTWRYFSNRWPVRPRMLVAASDEYPTYRPNHGNRRC